MKENIIVTKSYNFKYIWLILLGFVLPSFAQSESLVIKNLSASADVIVSGKVIQKKSSWNESQTRIYTRTTVQVEEFLKGQGNGNNVEITTPGGEVGDVGELYTHMPTFEHNEEVVVFLNKDAQTNEYKVLNGEQGKIRVQEDPATGKKVARSTLPLEDLKLQIKNFLSEQE